MAVPIFDNALWSLLGGNDLSWTNFFKVRDFLAEAKPKWTSKELDVVVAKLDCVGITNLNVFLAALNHSEALNKKLRESNRKGFSAETLLALSRARDLLSEKYSKTKWQPAREISADSRSAKSIGKSFVEPAVPSWEALPPAGWWRVQHMPSLFGFPRPGASYTERTTAHCVGKVLAMQERRVINGVIWPRVRDENLCRRQWLRLKDEDNLGDHDCLECLSTSSPPSLEARVIHTQVVETFCERKTEDSLMSEMEAARHTSEKLFGKRKGHIGPVQFFGVAGSDVPDWEAPAPAGWWRVISRPSVWASDSPFGSGFTGVHCAGKVLAMKATHSPFGTTWLQLRDASTNAEQWMPISGSFLGYGQLLEPLATGSAPPSEEVRASHLAVVECVLKQRWKSHGFACSMLQVLADEDKLTPELQYKFELLATVGASKRLFQSDSSVGYATYLHRSDNIRALMLRKDLMSSPIERLLKDGYVVIDDALPHDSCLLMEEARRLDETGFLGQADNLTKGQQTQGQRGDRIMWLSEDTAAARYDAPVIAATVAFLKGIADALNPAMSKRQAYLEAAGELGHTGVPLLPATKEAVLTAAPRAMLASYPGGAIGYMPHQDTHRYRGTTDKRNNHRELTAILYANSPDWNFEQDGGALRIWPDSERSDNVPNEGPPPVLINPAGGRLVVFLSALWHEVLPAHHDRRALTLWIFRPTEEP